jgi:hypothetical protein
MGRAGAGSCKIPGGNSDDYQNKGLAGKATQKLLKTKVIKIDGSWRRAWVAGKRKDEPGTRSVEP